jgi:hypothetical protein
MTKPKKKEGGDQTAPLIRPMTTITDKSMTEDVNLAKALVPLDLVPQEAWGKFQEIATLCKGFIEVSAIQIGNRRYLPVECWQAIAGTFGCISQIERVWSDEDAYRAEAVLVRMSDGAKLSRVFHLVGKDEFPWNKRARYANESMAQTRATSKLLRNAFAFVALMMKIPGLSTTPFEEIPEGGFLEDKENKGSAEESRTTGAKRRAPRTDSKLDELTLLEGPVGLPKDPDRRIVQHKDKTYWVALIGEARVITTEAQWGESLQSYDGTAVRARVKPTPKANTVLLVDFEPINGGDPDLEGVE